MKTITLEDAQRDLPQLLADLEEGEQCVITRHDRAIARLIKETPPASAARQPGFAKDLILHIASDFDAPLEDLREYTE